MRKFKDLKIGDSIFSIKTGVSNFLDYKDHYGNNYPQSVFFTHEVTSLKTENDKFIINGNGRYDLLSININQSGQSRIDVKENEFFISDIKEAHSLIRDIVLAEIKKREESIPKFIEKINREIEQMRKKYYESLNYLEDTSCQK